MRENSSSCLLRQVLQGADEMRLKYFPDTDTALVEFMDNEVSETREISEDIYGDLGTETS